MLHRGSNDSCFFWAIVARWARTCLTASAARSLASGKASVKTEGKNCEQRTEEEFNLGW